jgi:hypothetical protein
MEVLKLTLNSPRSESPFSQFKDPPFDLIGDSLLRRFVRAFSFRLEAGFSLFLIAPNPG